MTRKLTFLMTAMVLILAIMGPRSVAWGQTTYTELFTIASADVVTNSSYAKYETTVSERDWIITFGGNNKSVGTNSSNRSKCNLSSYSKYAVSPVTTSDVASAFVSKTSISDVSKISYTFNGGNNQTNTNVYLIYSSDGNTFSQVSLTSGTQGATISSGTAYEFAKCSGYFGLLFKATNSSGNWRIDDVNITFYKASTPSTDPSITVNPTTITWDNKPINVGLTETISVSQANLTEGITVSSTIGTVTPSTIAAGEDATDVTFTYTPTSVGDFEGEITFTSGEATATVSVTGSAYDPSQVDTYELFTGDLVEGDYVICDGTDAMKNEVTSNRLAYASVSISENKIVNPDEAVIWHISVDPNNSDYWLMYNEAAEKYAAFTSSNGNADLLDAVTDYARWQYSTVSGNKEFSNKGKTGKYLRKNGTYGFASYSTSTGNVLTLYKKAENKAATPTLTESQIFTTKPFEVTITNNEAGATVYYTTNGDDPTTETTTNFTGASTTININATTTVKAMAVVEGKANSEIASATYTEQKNDPENQWSAEAYTATIGGENTFPTFNTQSDGAVTYTSSNTNAATIDATGTITLVAAGTTTITASTAETTTYMAGNASYTLTVKDAPLSTMDAIFEKATAVGTTATNVEVTFNNWVISGVKNNNAYLTDNNGKGLIIYTSNHGFEVGDILSGTVTCKLQLYNGSAELTNLTAGTSGLTVTEGGTVTPVEMNIADLGGVNTGAVITVNNVEYTGSDIFSDGTNTIKAYNTFMTLPTFTNGDSYNFTGVYIQYNTTKEIAPRSAADIQLIVAAPTFTPEGGDYNAAQNVEIASVTAGAAIYYTLDGNDPTVESTLYSAPIELTSNTTLKAIAAKAGSVSEIATAVYTITITTVATPTFDPEGGSYFNESLAVSLDCATDGATIVYTTDNWSTQNNYTAPFTITETTTVKAKATKAAMDDSEIAEATYTKRYKVDYVVNGDAAAVAAVYVTPEDALGTLPTATAPNGYTFRGWNAGDVALTDVEPTYIAAETIPTGDMTLKAVFAMGETGETTFVTKDIIAEAEITSSVTLNADNNPYQMGELPITLTGIKGTSNFPALNYNATNGTDLRFYKGTTCGVTFATTNNSTITKIEFRKNESTASNLGTSFSANVGTLSANVWTGSAGSVTISYNNSTTFKEQMYIINVTYSETAPSTFYNYCTSVTALSGNLADATTVANTAYYISDESNVPANTTATINGVLGNADASLLVIEDGGQLICNNEVAATVKKNIEAIDDDDINGWYTIASPVKGSIDVPAAMTSNEYDLYYYDEPEYTWRNYEANSFQLANRKGYLYANRTDTDIEFAGTLRAGNEVVEVDLSYESTYQKLKGFNLVGNPFAHNIIMGTNAIMTNGNTGYYVVEHGANLVAKTFETPIKPCQGFMVQATVEGRKITFNPSSSAKETQTEHEYITIAAGNGDFMDMAYICTNADEKLGKITLDNPTAKVYLQQNGNDYAIAPLGEATSMVVCFKAPASGTYTINVSSDVEGVSLKDMKTGYVTAINHSASYTFEAGEDDAEGRFKILFGTTGVEENEAQMFVMQSGSDLIISGEGTVQIIDMMGRVLRSAQVESNATVSTEGLTAGAYVVRMLTAGGVQTQKVIVK